MAEGASLIVAGRFKIEIESDVRFLKGFIEGSRRQAMTGCDGFGCHVDWQGRGVEAVLGAWGF